MTFIQGCYKIDMINIHMYVKDAIFQIKSDGMN